MFGFLPFGWSFWLGVILGIIIILWLFWGGRKREFVGLKDGNYSNLFSRPRNSSRNNNIDNANNASNTDNLDDNIDGDEMVNDNTNNNVRNIANTVADTSTNVNLPTESLVSPIVAPITAPPIQNIIDHTSDNTQAESPVEIVENNQADEQPDSPLDDQPMIDNTPTIPDEIDEIAPEPGQSVKKIKEDSRGEHLCRMILQDIYKVPFPKVRPSFLRNPETGKPLELDGYNAQLRIAFEYNGAQHYVFPHRYNETKEKFIQQIRRDQFKIDTCDALGIYVITIPYIVPEHQLRKYIEYYLPENEARRNQQ